MKTFSQFVNEQKEAQEKEASIKTKLEELMGEDITSPTIDDLVDNIKIDDVENASEIVKKVVKELTNRWNGMSFTEMIADIYTIVNNVEDTEDEDTEDTEDTEDEDTEDTEDEDTEDTEDEDTDDTEDE